MKIKIKKTEKDLSVDYYKAENMHFFRSEMLEHIIKTQDSILIFVDTNSSIKKIGDEEIKAVLDECGLSYLVKPISSTEKKFFGLTNFFGGRNKKNKQESLYAISIDAESYKPDFYDGFLKHYDYAAIKGCKIPAEEALSLMAEDYDEILFNLNVCEATSYDSIIFARFRIAPNNNEIEDYIRKSFL